MKKLIALILVIATAYGGWQFMQKDGKSETPEKTALCIVLESDDLFPTVDFTQLHDEIYAVVEKYGYVRMIVADGKPFTAVDVDVPTPDKKYTMSKQRKMNESITDQIVEMMNAAESKAAENDLILALKRGKQELCRIRDAEKREMIVISSGISRAGNLRFQDFVYTDGSGRTTNALITAQPEEIVGNLAANYCVPDLSDVDDLIWYGLGSSAGKQAVPDSAQVKMEALWTAILEEAGCPAVFQDMALSTDPPQTETRSTVIDFGEDKFTVDLSKIEKSFDETSLGFVANEATFLDIDKAKQVLAPYAAQMRDTETELYLIGLTATFGDPGRCKTLSLDRANAVKELLVSQGAPESRLHTIGLGQGGAPLRVDDTIDADITVIESRRQQNRVVWLLGEDSDKAKALGI